MAWKKVEENDGLWTPEKIGDNIVGKLVAIRKTKRDVPMYDIDTGEKGIIAVYGWVILQKKMASVQMEDKVKIVYKCEVNTEHGAAKDFDVFVEGE